MANLSALLIPVCLSSSQVFSLPVEETFFQSANGYPSVCPSLRPYLSICFSVFLSVCLINLLSVCLSFCLAILFSAYMSACLCVCLASLFSACMSVCLPVCLSAWHAFCLCGRMPCAEVCTYPIFPAWVRLPGGGIRPYKGRPPLYL
jgi:hypothetical protein